MAQIYRIEVVLDLHMFSLGNTSICPRLGSGLYTCNLDTASIPSNDKTV